MKKEHKYGMRQRGYSLGCQPMNGVKIYIDFLKSDVAYDSKAYEQAKKELKEILEVQNGQR